MLISTLSRCLCMLTLYTIEMKLKAFVVVMPSILCSLGLLGLFFSRFQVTVQPRKLMFPEATDHSAINTTISTTLDVRIKNGEASTVPFYPDLTVSPQIIHWAPDWENKTRIGKMLRDRTKRITHLCEIGPPKYGNFHYTVVDNPRQQPKTRYSNAKTSPKLSYCHTAKSGSTFIRSVLEAVTRRHHVNKKRRNAEVSFTTIRNPWHRLVSVYLQKFNQGRQKKPDSSYCYHTVRQISSFQKFVQDCVLPSWRRRQINIHWLPALYRCEICKEKFDYIVATENLMNELGYMLENEHILDDATPLLEQVRSKTIRSNEKKGLSNSYQEYYKDLTPKDIGELREMYEDEIRILGYPDSPFVDSRFA